MVPSLIILCYKTELPKMQIRPYFNKYLKYFKNSLSSSRAFIIRSNSSPHLLPPNIPLIPCPCLAELEFSCMVVLWCMSFPLFKMSFLPHLSCWLTRRPTSCVLPSPSAFFNLSRVYRCSIICRLLLWIFTYRIVIVWFVIMYSATSSIRL